MSVSGVAARLALGLVGVATGVIGVTWMVEQLEQPPSSATTSEGVRVTQVVDGDTLVIGSGDHVRLIGIDTPERDTCGYQPAAERLRALVEGRKVTLVNPESVQDKDKYGRLLRYVDRAGLDTGRDLLKRGLAVARYDSRDGYDHHPRQSKYRKTDRAAASVCDSAAWPGQQEGHRAVLALRNHHRISPCPHTLDMFPDQLVDQGAALLRREPLPLVACGLVEPRAGTVRPPWWAVTSIPVPVGSAIPVAPAIPALVALVAVVLPALRGSVLGLVGRVPRAQR